MFPLPASQHGHFLSIIYKQKKRRASTFDSNRRVLLTNPLWQAVKQMGMKEHLTKVCARGVLTKIKFFTSFLLSAQHLSFT